MSTASEPIPSDEHQANPVPEAADRFVGRYPEAAVDARGPNVIVTLLGEWDFSSLSALQAAFEAAVADAPDTVCVDLAGATFIDVACLGEIRRMQHEQEARGARFELLHPSDMVRSVASVLGWEPLVDGGGCEEG